MAKQSFTDRVRRLYPNNHGLYIRHMNMNDDDGYFRLLKDHPNYDTLVSVAIIAAVNRHPLWVRIQDGTDDIVGYLVVDWNV